MSTVFPSDTPSRHAWSIRAAWARWISWIESRPWAIAVVYVLLSAIALYPIFSVSIPPLVDYPNHLARAYILSAWETTPALQQNYLPVYSLRPNMAMDLIVPALAPFMSIYMAGKIFIAMTLLSLIGGTLALRKVLVGRVDLWPVLAFLLLYNWAFFWGFLNFLFTAGLAMMAFSVWIAMRDRPVAVRLPIFCCAAFVLYVGHLFGLMVYGLLVGGYEIWRLYTNRPSIRRAISDNWATALQFTVPVALFVYWAAGNGTGEPTRTEYGDLIEKFAVLVSPTKFGIPYVDIPLLAFLALICILLRSSGLVGIARTVKLSLILMAVVAVVMPNWLMGVWATDARLPTIIALTLIAATRFDDKRLTLRSTFIVLGMFFLIVRAAAVTEYWAGIDRNFEEFREKSAAVQTGSKLLVVGDIGDLPESKWPDHFQHYGHMASIAVIERSVFLPGIFTGFTSVASAPANALIDSPVAGPISRATLKFGSTPGDDRPALGERHSRYVWAYWVDWPDYFDNVLVIGFGNATNPSPDILTPVAHGAEFDIHRVRGKDVR